MGRHFRIFNLFISRHLLTLSFPHNPNSNNSQSIQFPGPQDWVVSAVMRKSILYF